MSIVFVFKVKVKGKGRGHHGHKGRPGQVGGSLPGTGAGKIVPVRDIGGADIYSSLDGATFPKGVTHGRKYAAILMDTDDNTYITTTPGIRHAVLADAVGVKNYDMSLRVTRQDGDRNMSMITTFAPVIRGTAKDADAHASKRMSVAARKLISYGFPGDIVVEWKTLSGASVNLTLEEWL